MKPELRLFFRLVAAFALSGLAVAVADRMLAGRALAPGARLAVVLLPAVGFVPVIAALVRSVRHHEEYWQRIQLVALAVAFSGTGLATLAFGYLSRAGLIAWWEERFLFPIMVGLYVVAWFVAYFRYQ